MLISGAEVMVSEGGPLFGALGGFVAIIASGLLSVSVLFEAEDPRWKRTAASLLFAALIWAATGALVVWIFEGRAGDFVTGIGAISLLTGLVGLLADDAKEKDNA